MTSFPHVVRTRRKSPLKLRYGTKIGQTRFFGVRRFKVITVWMYTFVIKFELHLCEKA